MCVIQPQVNCASAREFIEALSPIGPYFKEINLGETWLFRGQGQDWPLIPSGCRESNVLNSLTDLDTNDYGQRLLALRDILITFFEIADKRGLVLPDDSQQLRSTLETFRSERGDHLIPKGYQGWNMSDHALSIMSLAQHYGIPTPLLDWSRQAFIAAFFAAESVYSIENKYETSSQLVVWAFYFPQIGKHDQIYRETDPLRIVSAPTATNPNLKAQQGVFTLANPFYTNEAEGNYQPLDRMLEDIEKQIVAELSSKIKILECRLRKFTLTISEAPQLLYLLGKMDITPSAIYPGYNSILRDIEMQQSLSKYHRSN